MQLSTQDSISSVHFGNVPAIPLIRQYGLRHPLAAPSLHSLPTSVYLTLAHPSLQLKNILRQGLSTHWCRQAVASLLSSLGSICWWPCRANHPCKHDEQRHWVSPSNKKLRQRCHAAPTDAQRSLCRWMERMWGRGFSGDAQITNKCKQPPLPTHPAAAQRLTQWLPSASLYSDNSGIFSTFLSYCNLASSTPHIGQNLQQAIKSWKRICAFRRNCHCKIIQDAGLNWKSPKQKIFRDKRFENARKIYAPYLDIPYPPWGEWVVKQPKVMHLWKTYLMKWKLPDKQGSHAPLHMINFDSLFALIGPNEDAVMYDKDTKEVVLVVYCNICAVDGLVDKADSVVIQAVDMLKNCHVSTKFGYTSLCKLLIHYPAWRHWLYSSNRLFGWSSQCSYVRLGSQYYI